MRGETVTVYQPVANGEDEHGDPAKTWMPTVVDDVLVRLDSTEGIEDADRPEGARSIYRLAFPKSYSGPDLKGCKVALTEREMDEAHSLFVIGDPAKTVNCPTRWNMNVKAGRTDG